MRSILPVLTIVAGIILFWMAAAVPMNMHLVADQAQRDGLAVTPDVAAERQEVSGLGLALRNPHLIPLTHSFVRPRLPAPQQVAVEMYDTIIDKKITSKRSLVYHGWVTLAPTLLGFVIGTGLGILLAVEPLLLEHLKPSAPLHMLSGLLALVLLVQRGMRCFSFLLRSPSRDA